MTIHYSKPVNITLTKCSQAIGKALARSHWQALVREIVRNPLTSPFLAAEVANVIRSESHLLVTKKSPSLLRKTTKADLLQFSWEALITELQTRAPLLLASLSAAAKSSGEKEKSPYIGMAAAILFKAGNKHMSAVQHIMSVLLNAGHANAQVCTIHYC